jgi:hypothetical protein
MLARLYVSLEGEQGILSFLEQVTAYNTRWLESHPEAPHPYRAGWRYTLETQDGIEDIQSYPELLKTKEGDCEDLATALAAWYRARKKIHARVILVRQVKKDGSLLYHAVVKLPDGKILDPSKRLGM